MLEKETDGKIPFVGLSVIETIRMCLLNEMSKRAEKARSDFKVPNKRYVYSLPHRMSHPIMWLAYLIFISASLHVNFGI